MTLQEIWGPSVALLEGWVAEVCPFPYKLVQGDVLLGVDDETVLSRYDILEAEQLRLFGNFPFGLLPYRGALVHCLILYRWIFI